MSRLRLFFLLSLTALPLHAACSTEPADSDSLDATSCSSARRDPHGKCRFANGKFAKDSCCSIDVDPLSCDVVTVDYGVSELEEGFGSLYDIDNDGYSQADEDSEDVSVDLDHGKPSIDLGQHSFSPADGDDISFRPATEETLYRTWSLKTSSREKYVIRVFPNDLGVVLYQGDPLGVLDCRHALDRKPAQADLAKMSDCNVVTVNVGLNNHLLEEGLGSIYDIDDEGWAGSDEDSTGVYLKRKPGGTMVWIGQMKFDQADGDAIAIEEGDESLSYIVRPKDQPDQYTVRLFQNANDAGIPGIGVVIYQETAQAEAEQLAVIDCRGIEAPARQE